MTNRAEDEAYLVLIDRYIDMLKKRLDTLRELIITMVAEGRDTKTQSELLFAMLHTMKSLKAFRAEILDDSNERHSALISRVKTEG